MPISNSEHGHTASVGDIEMYYELRGNGPPLVLLHGGFGASGDWKYLFDLDQLAESFQLIVPDLRGHGRSRDTANAKLLIRRCALDVFALLDSFGIETFRAVGLSLGAKTLLPYMATQQPQRVGSMVLVSPAPYFPAEARAIQRSMSFETQPPAHLALLREKHPGSDEQIRQLIGYANQWADEYDDMSFTSASMSRITAHTLIVYGDRDELYPVELALEMYRAMPDAALWVLPNAGHGPVFDPPVREEFVRRVRLFFDAAL